MTSHHLTIAKATFAASLLRPDIIRISRDELSHFHQLLDAVLLKCTLYNIQTCKQWLFDNVIPSPQRSAAFGKYLSSLSKHISKPDTPQKAPSPPRQRLHILYLLNDIFHDAKYHQSAAAGSNDIVTPFQSVLADLFQNAASEQKRNTCRRLEELIRIWREAQYITQELSTQLSAVLTNPALVEAAATTTANPKAASASKELPFLMPSTHGDPSLPFYELPAGNLMPHIIPNRKISMRTDDIRPLQFAPGPADDDLVNAVKDFLRDIDRMDKPFALEDEGIVGDIDDLGEVSYRNEEGELTGETYYGWSRPFCDKMRSLRDPNYANSAARSNSRTYSSRDSSPRRKRRYSDSSSDRSRSRARLRRSSEDRDADKQVGKGQLISRSPPQFIPTMSTDQPRPPLNDHQNQHQPMQATPSTPLNAGHAGLHRAPFLPGSLPVPPPRPPNWPAGSPWPPPPPPPPPIGMGGNGIPQMPFSPPPPGQHSPQGGYSYPYNSGPPPYYQR